jgi:hypothetical protein
LLLLLRWGFGVRRILRMVSVEAEEKEGGQGYSTIYGLKL